MFKKHIHLQGKDIFKEMQEIRKRCGVSLEKISKETKIPLKYLISLEGGRIDILPDVLYAKNIIKKYLYVLGVESGPFVSKLELQRKEKKSPKRALAAKKLFVFPRIIKGLIAIIFILLFIFYLGFKIKGIFEPPKIIIFSPEENQAVNTSIINIEGKTKPGTRIFINNEQVILDKDNSFSKEINLQKGLNSIKISGINRYSKENVIWRNVILEIN